MRARIQLRVLSNIPGFFLATSGSLTLAWVDQLTWHDITVWGKDLVLIFFGSRTGENISLGIGMKIIQYFLIGFALFLGFTHNSLKTKQGQEFKYPLFNQTIRERNRSFVVFPHFWVLGKSPRF